MLFGVVKCNTTCRVKLRAGPIVRYIKVYVKLRGKSKGLSCTWDQKCRTLL